MRLEHQPHPGPSVPQWWAGARDRGVYRQYSFVFSSIHNCWYISRDGHHIATEDTLAAVRATIDLIAD